MYSIYVKKQVNSAEAAKEVNKKEEMICISFDKSNRFFFILSCGFIEYQYASKASPKTTLPLPLRKCRFDALVLSQSVKSLCLYHKSPVKLTEGIK